MSSPRARTTVSILSTAVLAAFGCGPSDDAAKRAHTAAAVPPEQAGMTPTVDSIDWKAVDQAMGRSGSTEPGGVRRFGIPRSDLNVTSHGLRIKPALALGGWVAMKPTTRGVLAMGDLVLTEAEYNRAITHLQSGGVAQTAIHKHLPEHAPALWWTHVHAEGDPVQIARAVRGALALTKTPTAAADSKAPTDTFDLDTTQIRQVLGHSGKVNGGVYQVSVPRAETIRAHGTEVPPAMGTATVLNFQPTGNGNSAISGDFVMLAQEVRPVIEALRADSIEVVALHNHMLTEEPRLFFLHFWARDDAVKLAQALRAALDKTR